LNSSIIFSSISTLVNTWLCKNFVSKHHFCTLSVHRLLSFSYPFF
jgi:hypothetical protein